MMRINKGLNTWWKFNINTSREQKLKNWADGYRPEITGPGYVVKDIDPSTGEPELFTTLELVDRFKTSKRREYR